MKKYLVRIQWMDVRESKICGEDCPRLFVQEFELANGNLAMAYAMGVFINCHYHDCTVDFLHCCEVLNIDFSCLRDKK